jgi:hypothetical protein
MTAFSVARTANIGRLLPDAVGSVRPSTALRTGAAAAAASSCATAIRAVALAAAKEPNFRALPEWLDVLRDLASLLAAGANESVSQYLAQSSVLGVTASVEVNLRWKTDSAQDVLSSAAWKSGRHERMC